MSATSSSACAADAAPSRRRLLGHLGWYGAAEVAGRVTRLATTVVLARQLESVELGVAAAALTGFEIIRALVNSGLGQALIRAPQEQLAATCATVNRLAWAMCCAVAAFQAAIGLGMQAMGIGGGAGLMLAVLAGVYLVMAPGLVPVYLILRDQRLHVTAGVSVAQVVADNVLTILLVLAGFGAWGVVLPKLLVAPIWLAGVRRAQPWRRDRAAGFAPAGPLLRYAGPVLGADLLVTARMNLDNLLVGSILGVEALGFYFFIFNAGIGFSLSLTSALSNVLFPHLAAARGDRAALVRAFDRALRSIVPGVAALIALQAAAAIFYVPLVFGARWEGAAMLVALLCASAVTRPFADAGSQLLRAAGAARTDLFISAANTIVYLSVFAACLPFGLSIAITALTLTATVLQVGAVLVARHTVR
ncbi:polysaccharide biosynthesis protein [Rhodovarius crocodyli]|uniref:Polysaccharide biosynthesis protein n=1 Tax=Rhodovarius crocodyli TaxID=1979269 RepID=A0A437MGH0_9PROT|nr:oligosaccharide flippase family protein [Rhodovarius crocodyli]RVT96746.1 polysaccharide biosynthesis protein [Rhodovarius crocodyli]